MRLGLERVMEQESELVFFQYMEGVDEKNTPGFFDIPDRITLGS